MKTSFILAIFAAISTGLVAGAPAPVPEEVADLSADFSGDTAADIPDVDEHGVEKRANLPGLNAVQTKYAKEIIAQAKHDNVGQHGCQAGIATALVESTLIMYANKKVPASLKYHHERVAADHDSIGLFQQRASIYKNIKCDMEGACSAGQFFTEMKKVKGWQTMAVGTLCQKVQRSAFPTRYSKQVALATKVCKAGL